MTLRYLMRFLALLSGFALLAGCGTGSKPTVPNSGATVNGGRGTLQVTIAWPNKSSKATRLIPAASQSIDIRVQQGGNEVAHSVAPRPSDGFPTPTIVKIAVPAGDLTETVAAYPTPDGTGVAQASATVPVTIIKDTIKENKVEMNSTIATLQVSSSATAITTGKTAILTVTALDAASPPNIVLIDPSQLTYTSADGAALTIAAVGATATVTGVTAGSHKVNVTEKESGKTGTVTLTVNTSTPPPPTIPPTNIVVADVANNRIVNLDKVPATVFTPYNGTQSGGAAFTGNPADVAIDSKGRIYIADYPYKIVRIDDITGKGRVEYDPSKDTVQSGPALGASAVYVDSQGRIYWRDDNFAINRMDDMTGKNHVYFTNTNFGAPAAIATDGQGRIYVADGSKSRIYRFDDMTGSNVHYFGGDGVSAHLALAFSGRILDIDAAGELYVADNGNKRIVRLDPSAFDDAAKANLVAFPMPNDSTGVPLSVATVAVTHGTTPTIYFTAAGKGAGDEYVFHMDDLKGTNLVKYGTTGNGNGQFASPVGLAVK